MPHCIEGARSMLYPPFFRSPARVLHSHEDVLAIQVSWRRWEAHIWVGKGVNKQIYLGGYDSEETAAQAYDIAALKVKGFEAETNWAKDRCKTLHLDITMMHVHCSSTTPFQLCTVYQLVATQNGRFE